MSEMKKKSNSINILCGDAVSRLFVSLTLCVFDINGGKQAVSRAKYVNIFVRTAFT